MADKKSTQVAEFELLQKTFKGNTELLRKIRTLLLGFEISEEWKNIIRTTFGSPDIFKAFRKKIFADYLQDTVDAPIESISDNWSNSTNEVLGATKEKIFQVREMRRQIIERLNKGIKLLQDPDGEKVNTNYTGNEVDEWGIDLLARNYYVGSIQQGISTLSVMVNADIPSVGAQIKKAKKDSTE